MKTEAHIYKQIKNINIIVFGTKSKQGGVKSKNCLCVTCNFQF